MQYSSEEKAMWVEDWQQSGKSAWAYAKENGLHPQTFVKWTRAETASRPCFVEVPPRLIAPAEQASQITIEKGDVKIHIPLSEGCVELRKVMQALGGTI